MQQLIRAFVEIALFRKGPEDLPESQFLFGFSLALYLFGSTLTSLTHVDDSLRLILEVGVDAALLTLWFGGVLFFNQRMGRFRQTMSALYGATALLQIAIVPVLLWFESIEKSAALIPFLLIWFLIVWSVAIAANVIRRALQAPQLVGILIAFVYFMIGSQINRLLFWTDASG